MRLLFYPILLDLLLLCALDYFDLRPTTGRLAAGACSVGCNSEIGSGSGLWVDNR